MRLSFLLSWCKGTKCFSYFQIFLAFSLKKKFHQFYLVLWNKGFYFVSMITINGYRQVDFNYFLTALNNAKENSDKSHLKVAAEIDVKTAETARNAFRQKDGKQIVADEVLTKVMKAVGLSGFVIWIFGKKYYYIKNK